MGRHHGHSAAKRELRIVTEQIRRHSVAERLGLTMVKGVLIFGPPGSGKTMLAKALAAAVERPVYVIPAAELDAELVRLIYEQLADERCVIVWDEADILLRKRDSGYALDDGRIAAAFCSALDGVTPISGPVTVALTAETEWYLAIVVAARALTDQRRRHAAGVLGASQRQDHDRGACVTRNAGWPVGRVAGATADRSSGGGRRWRRLFPGCTGIRQEHQVSATIAQ